MKIKFKGLRFEHYILGLLLAVEMIMSFTFLGYIHIPPISITIAYIPIVVIACIFGPAESTLAGLFFGLGSMYKASSYYVMPDDRLFSPFQTAYPVKSVLLSVGTRVLFGLIIGIMFKLVKMCRFNRAGKVFCALIASSLHSFIVYSALGILFPQSGINYTMTFDNKLNNCIIAVFCLVVVIVCDMIYNSRFITRYKEAINNAEYTEYAQYWTSKLGYGISVIILFVIVIAIFSTIYFSDRAKYMLGVHNVEVTENIAHDILHLQIQFLAAMVSLNFILILIIMLIYKYMKYREFQGEIDVLTGIMGRRLFLNYCVHCQDKSNKKQEIDGWFLFVDVDWFKQINDTFGHAIGDKTLQLVAENLKNTFKEYGAVGRVGGDEFAVIIEKKLTKEELESKLDQFLLNISGILPERKVSCSIGAYHFIFPQDVNNLLKETDEILYQAKENGRACFKIKDVIQG